MKTLEDVLEEIAPVPDPDFVADMEWRMQHGFPQPERKHPLARFALPSFRPRTVAAVAASALLALLVSVSLLGGGQEDGGGGGGDVAVLTDRPASDAGGGAATPREAAPAQGQSYARDGAAMSEADSVAPVPPIPGHEDTAPRSPERRVERSAQITLAADPDDFDGIADSVFRTADRRDGFVLRSTYTQGEGGGAGGFFELRVPAGQLEATLAELSRIATVRARSESGNDVTGAFVSMRDRLRTARADRKGLLRRLEVAPTETAASAIRRRLAIVGRRITSLNDRIRRATERTAFATVLVELIDEATDAASQGETDEAVDDAVGTLEDILNFLIRAVGVLLPVAIVGLLVWLAASRARRRARDRALA